MDAIETQCAEVFMNISEASLARSPRTRPFGPGAATRVADSQKKLVSGNLIGKWALYVVPHIAEDRMVCIAKLAYIKAECRGFAPGHELEDWLAAENEVDQRLAGEGRVF
jgi:hypothetical protein